MQIAKYHWKTEEAFNCIRNGKPVVLLECPIIYPAYSNWSLQSIAQMIKNDFPCDVFVSKTKRFPYWDDAKNSYNYDFTPSTKKVTMTFREFLRLRESGGQVSDDRQEKDHYYLQQSLVAEMGPVILQEYTKFSLPTAELYKLLAGWNELTHNLLLCGNKGFITPLHFDEQENLFSQLQGRKRVRLFAPEYWYALYPFPNGHPQDRQCQIILPETPGTQDLKWKT
jgi:hypoxia-inducible factor 1-alpha inhibitor (HIF hydroxylase)